MLGDPAEFFANLRELGPVVPVHLDGNVPAWLAIGYDACRRVLRDGLSYTRDLAQWSVVREGRLPAEWPLTPQVMPMDNMLYATGEEHPRLRQAFKDSLLRAGVGSQRIRFLIRKTADELINAFADRGQADIVSEYALPLPVNVLARLFGYKHEEVEQVRRLVLTLLSGGQGALAADTDLTALIETHVARRRQEPRADIVTGLLEAGLSDEQTSKTVWLTIIAGIGSTTAWTASTCDRLARAEDARSDLRGGLRNIQHVMAEVLWDQTPIQQVIGRVATADRILHGRTIRRGDLLILSLAGANSDYERLGSQEGRYDNESHLSWGAGAHECPAQGLASAIVRGGVERLWTRLDDLHLTHPERPTVWDPSITVRIASQLGVSWDAARARARAETLSAAGGTR